MSYTIYPKKIIKLITLVAISRELLLNIRALSIIRISSPSRPNNNIVPILVTSLFVTYPYIASRINTIEVAKKVIAIEDILNDKNINDFPILLVVEDNNDIRDYITISMENNYHVLTATNGKEGMELANKYIPDIIISDVMMPEMDGIEFCKQIKRDIRTCHIPVILLTAKDSIQDKEDGYRSGADSYLTKPFSIRLLNSRILNLLETRKKLAEIIIESNQRITPFSKGQQDGVILGKLDKDFLDRFSNIVQENITMEKLDLNFMTEKMNMSHSTLYRKIKGLTGMSGNEFIRKLKLNYGAFLLKENKLNISETAYACGFNDINYFRKCFKEEYGITPSQYLKQL